MSKAPLENVISTKSATMNNQLYNSTAMAQLGSHEITKDALKDCLIQVLNSYPCKDAKILRISDLGSAGGVNAIQLLKYIENILQEYKEIRPIEYFFEDLPTSDFSTLVKTIHESNISDQFYPRCIGKSFYENLFPSNSIHLCLSYITLHWLRSAPSIKDYANISISGHDLNFFQPNERNVKPEIFELWRNASINDLALFLQLRADELVDNGAGLFLMVGGGGSLDADKKNNPNPYGGQIADFLNGSANGSIFREAFENAAKDPEFMEIANIIHDLQLEAFCPYFLRCETDVLESFDKVKDLLELKELEWQTCNIPCGSPEKLVDFLWSIHGYSIEEPLKEMLSKENDLEKDQSIGKNIIDALKLHMVLLANKYFPDGQVMVSYMYMVVKRRARK